MDAEKDVEDFRLPCHGLHLSQGVVFLLRPEGAFHGCGSHSGELFPYESAFIVLRQFSAFLCEIGFNMPCLAQFAVLVAGVAVVTRKFSHVHTKEPSVKRDAMLQAGALVEGVEGDFLYKGYSVDLYVVALGSELNVLVLLSSHDWADVRLADADNSAGDALTCVTTVEVVVLLAVYLGDDINVREVYLFQGLVTMMLSLQAAYLLQYLPQKGQFTADKPSGLLVLVAALLHISHVRLCHVKVLGPGTVDAKGFARLAHGGVGLLYALPQQLRICRIAHTALVAGGIGEQCVQVLHVWLPCLGKRSLDRLYLQMAGQLRHHLVDNLVARQRFHWMNPDAAEYLVVNVAVELLHQHGRG